MNPSETVLALSPPVLPKNRSRLFWPPAVLTLATGGSSMLLISQISAILMAATVAAPAPHAPRLHSMELVSRAAAHRQSASRLLLLDANNLLLANREVIIVRLLKWTDSPHFWRKFKGSRHVLAMLCAETTSSAASY